MHRTWTEVQNLQILLVEILKEWWLGEKQLFLYSFGEKFLCRVNDVFLLVSLVFIDKWPSKLNERTTTSCTLSWTMGSKKILKLPDRYCNIYQLSQSRTIWNHSMMVSKSIEWADDNLLYPKLNNWVKSLSDISFYFFRHLPYHLNYIPLFNWICISVNCNVWQHACLKISKLGRANLCVGCNLSHLDWIWLICRYRTIFLKMLIQSLKFGPLPDKDFDTTTERFNAV